ncbi:TetR family transcriptional regulator [Nocardia sp. NPDC020380]|uniref:TetR family transcriptional regulator n=1 Tax=Nocardia sp. NPDC020380 TaxID=3364309 RepID=UPI00379550F1
MTDLDFARARTPEAKRARQETILAAATRLATAASVREVTASAIADEVGMHKSAMLRYFETREDIFLQLAADAWGEWSSAVRVELEDLAAGGRHDWDQAAAHEVASVVAHSLVARPLFCDLLAQTPLNLERNVSQEKVKAFKLRALAAVAEIGSALCVVTPLQLDQARSVVATATAMAGAMWQMAAPGTNLRAFYESESELAHAIVDVEPSLTDLLATLMIGYVARSI